MLDLPIVCSLTEPELQQRREAVFSRIAALVQERRALDNGYALRFAAEDAILEELIRLIQLERVCCPFLQFRLIVEQSGGPVWLELVGPEGTRAFLEAELGLQAHS
ncbi:MAG: hypothetical protein KatS3mg057_1753 [Herpetosiphonaceae bacterium]|nr:MAG: hypothetical protein KatS3mg057_1753 [Herpetosiphonaceae bacterium]